MKKRTNLSILSKTTLRYWLLCGLFTTGVNVMAQQLAFPTAQGFGRFATGGRGGKVYFVTNLNDSGAGSLREAFNAYPNDPLTVIFRVGGIINLLSEIKIKRSNVTVAGQTAPGDGICIKGNSFMLNGARAASQGGNHGNVIIRYIRSRPGSTLSTGVYGYDMENCHDVIVDHCSFSWANEECAACTIQKMLPCNGASRVKVYTMPAMPKGCAVMAVSGVDKILPSIIILSPTR